MNELPLDVKNAIAKSFKPFGDIELATEKLTSLFHTNLNVGADQLARSILVLADGQIDKLSEIFNSNFYGDPRDVIMMAMEKSNQTINWGNSKLD